MSDDEIHEIYKSDQPCCHCGESLLFGDEAVLLEVVQPYIHSVLQYSIPLADDGDYEYEPVLFEIECLSHLLDDLILHLDNRLMTTTRPDDYAILECSICGSGIRQWEFIGLARQGMVIRSNMLPSAEKNCSNQCLTEFNIHICEIWEDLFQGMEWTELKGLQAIGA